MPDITAYFNQPLLALAAGEPTSFTKGRGPLEFRRTVSRLEDIRSDEYLGEGHGV